MSDKREFSAGLAISLFTPVVFAGVVGWVVVGPRWGVDIAILATAFQLLILEAHR